MLDWSKYLIEERHKRSTKGKYDGSSVDKRNAFDSDFGRALFSSGLRRMHDKTQVIPLTSGDYVHTRLTHSLEVMNIAASIAENICRHEQFIEKFGDKYKSFELEQKILPILRTAAIMHDVGNPPFGHFGEDAIQNFFKYGDGRHYLEGMDNRKQNDFLFFDGNAQGFRILTKLQYLGDLYGLNLTYATLASYVKYPNYGPCIKKDKQGNPAYIGLKKHGIMYSEKVVFENMSDKCSMNFDVTRKKRHPLSFIVEAADSICYSTMDMEDGVSLGWFDTDDVRKFIEDYILKKVDKEKYIEYIIKKGKRDILDFNKIIGFKDIVDGEKIIRTKTREVVDFRVSLIDYFVRLAVNNFMDKINEIDGGTYSKELIEDDPLHVAEALQNFCRKKMFVRREIRETELTGEAVLTGLLRVVLKHIFSDDIQYRNRITSVISESRLKLVIHENLAEKGEDFDPNSDVIDFPIDKLDPYYKIKLAIDWITSMTDKYAVEVFQKLTGNAL